MRKLIAGLFFSTVLLAGCTTASPAPTATPAVKKAQVTTLSGTVTKAEGKYFLQKPGMPTTEIDSYTVKMEDLVGKSVTVSGQYSGTTLFIDTAEE